VSPPTFFTSTPKKRLCILTQCCDLLCLRCFVYAMFARSTSKYFVRGGGCPEGHSSECTFSGTPAPPSLPERSTASALYWATVFCSPGPIIFVFLPSIQIFDSLDFCFLTAIGGIAFSATKIQNFSTACLSNLYISFR